jgi:hypothetical protein
MTDKSTNEQAETLALSALAWVVSDPNRADRFLALTGLGADDLRARVRERSLQAAVLAFLEAHEPDLFACAEALDVSPAELVIARERLEQEGPRQSTTLAGNP